MSLHIPDYRKSKSDIQLFLLFTYRKFYFYELFSIESHLKRRVHIYSSYVKVNRKNFFMLLVLKDSFAFFNRPYKEWRNS